MVTLTHAGFSGSGLTGPEVINLAKKTNEVEDVVFIELIHANTRDAAVRTRVYANKDAIITKFNPSENEGSVTYALDFHKITGVTLPGNTATIITHRGDATSKIFGLTSPTDITGLGLDNAFSYKRFRGEVDTNNDNTNDAKIDAYVATDYATNNASNYMTWGFWLQVPKTTATLNDYNFGAFTSNKEVFGGSTLAVRTGSATYNGSLIGLHTSLSNGSTKISRLTGDAQIVFNFGNQTQEGNFTATFNSLKLDGTDATGSITFADSWPGATARTSGFIEESPDTATINDNSYQGNFTLRLAGPGGAKPTGITGMVNGATDDGNNKFVAAFGAKR